MTNERAKSELMQLYGSLSEEKKQALDVLMAQAEKTCDLEKSNFDVRQYKLDTDTAYECGYNAGLQAQADGDAISRQAVIDITWEEPSYTDALNVLTEVRDKVKALPPVKPQEPKTGHCKDCKHFRKLPYHADTLGKCFNHMGLCPKGDWYCADFEP